MTVYRTANYRDDLSREEWDFLGDRPSQFVYGQIVRLRQNVNDVYYKDVEKNQLFMVIGPQNTSHVFCVVLLPLGYEEHPNNFIFWIAESCLEHAVI